MIAPYELKNPFTNCRVESVGADPREYHLNQLERGDVRYPVSRSMLLAVVSCPAKWIADWAPKGTEATEWGTLIDCMLLTPDKFSIIFAVQPKTYPAPKACTAVKDGKCKEGDPIPWDNRANFCKSWNQLQDGKQIVSDEELSFAGIAHSKLVTDNRIFDLLMCSKNQVLVSGDYHDEATGLTIPVKCLIDLVPDKNNVRFRTALADVKTTRSAHPRTWLNSVYTFGYDAQAAMCLWMYSDATKEERIEFYHVIQENTHPWQVARRMLSQEFLEIGRIKIMNALKTYCQCLKTGVWPNWDDGSPFNGWSLVEPAPWMATIEDVQPSEDPEAKPEYELTAGN